MATILILDEQADSCMLIKRVLERDEHTVFTAAGPDHALSVVKSRSVDLVILDINPHGKGLAEFASEIKEIDPGLKVLTITHSASDFADKMLWDDFVLKPVDIEQLESKVRTILKTRALTNTQRL